MNTRNERTEELNQFRTELDLESRKQTIRHLLVCAGVLFAICLAILGVEQLYGAESAAKAVSIVGIVLIISVGAWFAFFSRSCW